jgi:phosphoesterase RecJ-like protein
LATFAAVYPVPLKPITDIRPLLFGKPSPKIVITTHHKPDADALGSSLGLYNFLTQMGIPSTVVSPTDYGDFLKWMPGEKHVVNFEKDKAHASKLVLEADFIFCLDFNALKRINEMGTVVAASPAKKVLIDHHLEPEDFAGYGSWTTQVSSTCELVVKFITDLGETDNITPDVAACLYAGMMTDTASFRHASTFPSTHRTAALLLEKGAKPNLIHEEIYDNYSLSRTKFIGHCLSEKLEVLPGLNTVLITITSEELDRYHVITGDTEGLVNYGLSIKDIRLSVLIVDRKVLRKMSFRSKGNFPANELARKYFNGGGHFNAAGGESPEPLAKVVEKFKTVIEEYRTLLT